jgi:hypothetical protein
VHQTKEPEHKQDFDEWLARIICYAFSVPPQWAVKLMNRATADNQSAQAEDEGLEPTKEWVKDLVDEIIADEFGSPDLELVWLDEDTGAAQAEAQLEARVKIGAATLNELRDALGLDPFQNPAADRPMVLTASGYVPIEANGGTSPDGGGQATDARSAPAVRKYNPDQPRVPAGQSGGGQWTSDGGGGSSDDSMVRPVAEEHPSSGRGLQYAALETDTRTDATANPGNGQRSNSDPQYAAVVTPRGFTVDHIPGTNPLDPKRLNSPIVSADEQQKIAAALTTIFSPAFATLHPHIYENRPHYITGAVLPPSAAGYMAYDVPGFGSGRGRGRIIIDNATGEMYYTNNHYLSFYHIELHQHPK